MNIINQNEIINELKLGLKNPPRTAIVEYIDNQVNYGFDAKPNFDYCKQHNIECVDIGRRGGAFVVNKGDVGLGHIAIGLDNTLGELIYKKFSEYLKNKGLNAIATQNDILVDGYKVFGWSSHYYKEYNATFISIHFTMSVNIDLIKSICTKPMSKTPKGLSEYGISTNEIKAFIKNNIS